MPNTSTNRTSAEPRQLPGTPCSTASRTRAARQTCVQRRAALAGFITQNSCGGYSAANHGVNDQTTMPAAASAASHTAAPLGPFSAGAEPSAAPRYTEPPQGRGGNTATLCWRGEACPG